MCKTLAAKLLPGILLLFALFALTACSTAREAAPPTAYVGNWYGLGRVTIPSEYMNQRQLSFALVIEENGNVKGYVGDAFIERTKLMKSAWWMGLIGRKYHNASFSISGAIVTRESFRREGGTLTIHKLENDELLCSFNSTGSHASVDNLMLTVRDIKLARVK